MVSKSLKKLSFEYVINRISPCGKILSFETTDNENITFYQFSPIYFKEIQKTFGLNVLKNVLELFRFMCKGTSIKMGIGKDYILNLSCIITSEEAKMISNYGLTLIGDIEDFIPMFKGIFVKLLDMTFFAGDMYKSSSIFGIYESEYTETICVQINPLLTLFIGYRINTENGFTYPNIDSSKVDLINGYLNSKIHKQNSSSFFNYIKQIWIDKNSEGFQELYIGLNYNKLNVEREMREKLSESELRRFIGDAFEDIFHMFFAEWNECMKEYYKNKS